MKYITIKRPTGQALSDYELSEHYTQGWELAGFTHVLTDYVEQYVYIFKKLDEAA